MFEKYTITQEIIEKFNLTDAQIKRVNQKIDTLKKDYSKSRFTIIIEGEPIHAQRPRTGKFGNIYVPGAAQYKKKYKPVVESQLPEGFEPFNTACTLVVNIYRPMVKSFSQTDTVLAEMGIIRPMTTPDIDNRIKPYMDICKDVIYKDDGQVVGADLQEYYSINPRVELTVEYDSMLLSTIFKKK